MSTILKYPGRPISFCAFLALHVVAFVRLNSHETRKAHLQTSRLQDGQECHIHSEAVSTLSKYPPVTKIVYPYSYRIS